jgi:photosystem II stability/assembly factor-like uncharacterized protein
MQFNTLARSGAGLVAGGELGKIMLSADAGKSWQPARVEPQRHALINQIVFADDKFGMAVGHEGWILRSEDGGRSWHEVHFDQDNGTPLMSVAKLPSGQWLAVGAFGRVLRSDDDGKTWSKSPLPGIEDQHLNRIVAGADPQHWLIVGERGVVLRSSDGGANWSKLPPFYNGSLYGAMPLGADGWIVYGMRGNVYVSNDAGASWTKSQLPAPVSTFASLRAKDGQVLLVGQGGMVLASGNGGASFHIVRRGDRSTLMDIAPLPGGDWLLASDSGLRRLDLPAPAHSGSDAPLAKDDSAAALTGAAK